MTLEVKVRNNNVEKAIRQLKKKVMKEGILKEVKMRQYYEKPTLKRQRKDKENLKRINNIYALEGSLYSKQLGIAGTVDCGEIL